MTPTPKDKAEMLTEKFYQSSPETFGAAKAMTYAIKCAIIAVDEITQSKPIMNGLEYWQEVKNELEKM
jgi:hypothetical protein